MLIPSGAKGLSLISLSRSYSTKFAAGAMHKGAETFRRSGTFPPEVDGFSVLSWNVLADCYAFPKPGPLKTIDRGVDITYAHVSDASMKKWESRSGS